MSIGPQLVLVGAVATVGVFHTMVPDHWVPITLVSRQKGWSRAQTALAGLKAGTGHVLSTLAIAIIVWGVGVVFAQKFGSYLDAAASLALIAFGLWVAFSGLGEGNHDHAGSHTHHGQEHVHGHNHQHAGSSKTLILILGSSPMVEGIPAFFAATKYGAWLIVVMALVFASTTIVTYVALCVLSSAGLERIRVGALERYGETLSGLIIALVGAVFWLWPAMGWRAA